MSDSTKGTLFLGFAVVFFLAFSFSLYDAGWHDSVHAQTPHGTASEEIPRGAIDGVNTVFTLNFQPAPWASIHVYLNGLRLHRNYDYVLGGPNMEQIQFAPPATAPTINIPLPGDLLLVDYTY